MTSWSVSSVTKPAVNGNLAFMTIFLLLTTWVAAQSSFYCAVFPLQLVHVSDILCILQNYSNVQKKIGSGGKIPYKI